MKKRLLALTLSLLLVLVFMPATTALASEQVIIVTVDGVPVEFDDQEPVIVDGRTLVPVRGVFEQMGFEVDWDEDAWTAILTRDDDEVRIIIDTDIFTTNDVEHTLDVPAQLIGSRTMIPLRAVLESVGYYLEWWTDGETDFVVVGSAPVLPIDGMYFSSALDTVDLSNRDITDLTEIAEALLQMPNLISLNLGSNQISDLTPIAGLTNLTVLSFGGFGGNLITDLSPLAEMTNMTSLALTNNQITDLTPLAGMTYLASLGLGGNQVTDMSPLAELSNLRYLWLWGNQISELPPLGGMTSLVNLDLSENPISDVSPVAALTGLTHLSLSSTEFYDFSMFAEFPGLEMLGVTFSEICDEQLAELVDAIVELPYLTELALWVNEISDLEPLTRLTNLTTLWLSENLLTDISPLAEMINLTVLGFSSNEVTDISPLSELINLTMVFAGGNPITDWSPVDHVDFVDGRP